MHSFSSIFVCTCLKDSRSRLELNVEVEASQEESHFPFLLGCQPQKTDSFSVLGADLNFNSMCYITADFSVCLVSFPDYQVSFCFCVPII